MPSFKYPKKPKAPKASASIESHNRFKLKMSEWAKECAEIDRKKKAHADAVKRTQQLKAKGR